MDELCGLFKLAGLPGEVAKKKVFPLSFDEDINIIVTPTTPATIHTGPITRARARQLNY